MPQANLRLYQPPTPEDCSKAELEADLYQEVRKIASSAWGADNMTQEIMAIILRETEAAREDVMKTLERRS